MALISVSNNALSNISVLPDAIPTGALVLLSTQTASSSASISFTSGIDSTYDSYVFKFIDIHPETNNSQFSVNFRDGGSLYDAIKTTTHFRAFQDEAGTSTSLTYASTLDLAQSTGIQPISGNMSNDNDSGISGELHLFNPSSTTYVKHFISKVNYQGSAYSINGYVAGYCNVAVAIDGVQFSFSSGNIDDGIIKMYGVK